VLDGVRIHMPFSIIQAVGVINFKGSHTVLVR